MRAAFGPGATTSACCRAKRRYPARRVWSSIMAPHFASFRRVTRLRCTSCHSQIVQGDHMTVTLSTCFTCHFKNRDESERMAQCETCHTDPRDVDVEGASYDHTMVQERGVDCIECHSTVVRGTGFVAEERCWVCHAEPDRIARMDDTEFMHAQTRHSSQD